MPAAPAKTRPRKPSRTPGVRLFVRQARKADIPAIRRMMERAYPVMGGYERGHLLGQMSAFPEGQLVGDYGGEIVGYASTFRIDQDTAFGQHSWTEISGDGFAARHDPKGEWLYGMEVCVDPAWRGLRVGQRLYDARRRLVEDLELKGVVFGGRLPGLRSRMRKFGSAEAYLEAVKERKVRDQVASFQLGNGFEALRILTDYLPEDVESMGYAALMVWRNPYVEQSDDKRSAAGPPPRDWVRVATVQYQARAVESFDDFMGNVEYFVDVCAGYKSDFAVFPELFTLQLLSFEKKKLGPVESIEALTRHTEPFIAAMQQLALRYNINIIGGSHPTRMEDGDIHNVAYVFLRDGTVHAQEKIHPTPNERHWWNIKGGDAIEAIDTDCGPIGVLICYDSEFPELGRRLADEGARILFVPFCTDNRQGYMRVRYCCQARAIENQCYVVMSGNVGNLPKVENMDVQYAQSCILSPCDFPFARDGIAAEASENVETVTVADLDFSDLDWARREGTVRNLRDRRFDLYKMQWKGPKS